MYKIKQVCIRGSQTVKRICVSLLLFLTVTSCSKTSFCLHQRREKRSGRQLSAQYSAFEKHTRRNVRHFCISETDIMITLHSFGGGTAPDLLAARKAPLTAHSSWACFTSVRRARHSFTHRHLSNIAKWKKNSSTAEPVQTWFISYRHRLQSRKKMKNEWRKMKKW